MDTLIPVVIILGIVCFVGYKNREKISALYDKVQNDGLDDEPEVVTSAPEVVTPYKVEPVTTVLATGYNGQGDPPSQEAWAEWRKKQPASTRAYIPEVWKPAEPVKSDPTHNKPQPFPASWDYSPQRIPVEMKAGVTYSVSFVDDGKPHQILGTANVNLKRVTPKIVFRNSKGIIPIPTRSQEFNVTWGPGTTVQATEGINSLEFTAPKDGGFTLILKH